MYTLITVDVEPDFPSGKYEGIKELDKFLDLFNHPLTLFITPDIFQKFPNIIEKWSIRNEIGYHLHPFYLGYKESDYLNYYKEEKQKEMFKKGLEIINKTYDLKKIKSFRTGRFAYSEYLFQILEEFGFTHDSSIKPDALSDNKIKKIENIIEIPPTIWTLFPLKILYKLGFLNTGGFIFYEGTLKRWYWKALYIASHCLSQIDCFVFAFHPYDLLNLNLKNRIKNFIDFLLIKRRSIRMSEINL